MRTRTRRSHGRTGGRVDQSMRPRRGPPAHTAGSSGLHPVACRASARRSHAAQSPVRRMSVSVLSHARAVLEGTCRLACASLAAHAARSSLGTGPPPRGREATLHTPDVCPADPAPAPVRYPPATVPPAPLPPDRRPPHLPAAVPERDSEHRAFPVVAAAPVPPVPPPRQAPASTALPSATIEPAFVRPEPRSIAGPRGVAVCALDAAEPATAAVPLRQPVGTSLAPRELAANALRPADAVDEAVQGPRNQTRPSVPLRWRV